MTLVFTYSAASLHVPFKEKTLTRHGNWPGWHRAGPDPGQVYSKRTTCRYPRHGISAAIVTGHVKCILLRSGANYVHASHRITTGQIRTQYRRHS